MPALVPRRARYRDASHSCRLQDWRDALRHHEFARCRGVTQPYRVTQPFRLPRGGQIDRGRILRFSFDGRAYEGHPGDTLASALLANGVRLVARSFKYHRPRGIFAAGPEEPSALLRGAYRIGEEDGTAWAAEAVTELAAMPEVRLLPATTVLGRYDDNYFVAAERVGDLLGPAAPAGLPRLRLWHIRARQIVLAAGALERPLVFPGNDRPGVMLASAVESYIRHYAVLPGRRAVVFADNDDAYRTAATLTEAGAEIAAIVDPRDKPGLATQQIVRTIPLYTGCMVVGTGGHKALRRVTIRPIAGSGSDTIIDCDLLAVSGGWNPTLHLYAQAQGRTRFDEGIAAFVPDGEVAGVEVIGAARGSFALSQCLAEGAAAGARAATSCGFASGEISEPPIVPDDETGPNRLSLLPLPQGGRHAFVDLHNDVTAADIALAARDGVALLDASTLGKIEVAGPDAGRFLDRIYINRWQNLGVGHCRYGVMCREDGMVFDDGVGARLAPDRFFLTTTTGNAAAVFDWLEEWLQTEWPELDVFCTSVTEEWANATLVGWAARDVLALLAPGLALDSAAFPHMTMRAADIGGIPARIFRVSFSGELSYEINVPADQGLELWERLIAVGELFGITPS